MTITGLGKAEHAMTDHPDYRAWLASVGFARSDVYIEGWDDEADESDDEWRARCAAGTGRG